MRHGLAALVKIVDFEAFVLHFISLKEIVHGLICENGIDLELLVKLLKVLLDVWVEVKQILFHHLGLYEHYALGECFQDIEELCVGVSD